MDEIKHESKNDFSQGSVVKNILTLAVPMTLAQLINVLYNIWTGFILAGFRNMQPWQ